MRRPFPSPADFVAPALIMARMMAEANLIVALRLWGLAGAWPMAANERARMVTEKTAAAQDAVRAAARAAAGGSGAGAIAAAAAKPVARRTRANAARLSKAALRRPPN